MKKLWHFQIYKGSPCLNSFRPPAPSVKRANVEKKYLKPSWQALTPPGNVGKKVPQTILANLYPPPLWAMPIWKQHISKRGFPYLHTILQ